MGWLKKKLSKEEKEVIRLEAQAAIGSAMALFPDRQYMIIVKDDVTARDLRDQLAERFDMGKLKVIIVASANAKLLELG
jgi:hypothetical protein